MLEQLKQWFDRNIIELARECRWSYLPPLMVYLAYGLSSFTGIAATFFVKDYLGLSAAFLAGLAFWVSIPWALKIPVGHAVDLLWRHKAYLVYLGALLVAASMVIMVRIVAEPDAMRQIMSLDHWYVIASLLAPVGYVLQDAVADAMTVEAVPRVDEQGNPVPPETRRLMNTTVQTLGRIAIILGGALVAVVNAFMFAGTEALPKEAKTGLYAQVFELALIIPLISIMGVVLAERLRRRRIMQLRAQGMGIQQATAGVDGPVELTSPQWSILGGGIAYAIVTVVVGLFGGGHGQEIIFALSFVIIALMMWRLLRELDPVARTTLLGTAIIIFSFRATPLPGDGVTWWMIDELKFDQGFLAKLSLISNVLTLLGLFAFRRFMGEHSIARIVVVLSLASFVLGLPTLGMYYGLHEWTAKLTGGVVDARFIAVVNTALESPLGQVSMVPMLAWIANSAPAQLKATYFAVMASFTNLALTASQLGAKYLNEVFTVTRQVTDATSGQVTVPADYSQLGVLLIIVTAATLVMPLGAVLVTRAAGMRSD